MFRLTVDSDIELSLPEHHDAPQLFALIDSNRARLRQWLAWVDGVTSPDSLSGYISGARAQWAAEDGYTTLVRYRGELAGSLGQHNLNHTIRAVEMGYWMGEAFGGQGVMTRASRALIEIAFGRQGLNRVEIRAATGNRPSQAVAERLGFVREGQIRDGQWLYDHYVDMYVYGMLARDWGAAA
ncbi:GNAT family N-acetyltransferase [Chloroflexia bacterium SDU3-3]|nr:GNAT family N-acetyltransferase [Chloroflexia bacterium SDU3-3]